MPENDQEPDAAVMRIRRTIRRTGAQLNATHLAAPVLGVAAGVLIALTVRHVGPRGAFNAGLACGVAAVHMACTTAILRAHRDTAIQECHVMTYFDRRLSGVEKPVRQQFGLLRGVVIAAGDDLARRRNRHH